MIRKAITEKSVDKISELSVEVTGVVSRLERKEKGGFEVRRHHRARKQYNTGIDGVK